jgi:hypothetical protein
VVFQGRPGSKRHTFGKRRTRYALLKRYTARVAGAAKHNDMQLAIRRSHAISNPRDPIGRGRIISVPSTREGLMHLPDELLAVIPTKLF